MKLKLYPVIRGDDYSTVALVTAIKKEGIVREIHLQHDTPRPRYR